MQTTPEHNERMAKMTFSSVYPHYVTKVEKKGRTKVELQQVISRRRIKCTIFYAQDRTFIAL
jgi:hypothetical protein